MLSYQQEKNNIEGKKQIILNPNENQKLEKVNFGENEVYGVDILISTGEGKVRVLLVNFFQYISFPLISSNFIA